MGYLETQNADLIQAGSQELDGDKVDIDTAVVNITPDTGGAEVDNVAQLGALIAGIDNALGGSFTPSAHAASHIGGGSDAIDGDKVSITWTGMANYSADASPAEADSVDDLTAHLKGIDTALASAGSNDNGRNVTSVSTGTTADISPTFNADNDIEVCVYRITAATDGTTTLPAIAAADIGSMVEVKLVGAAGANKVAVSPEGTDTIDDVAAAVNLNNSGQALRFVVESATNWIVS